MDDNVTIIDGEFIGCPLFINTEDSCKVLSAVGEVKLRKARKRKRRGKRLIVGKRKRGRPKSKKPKRKKKVGRPKKRGPKKRYYKRVVPKKKVVLEGELDSRWPSFEEAKVMVRERGIKSVLQYKSWINEYDILFLPKAPHILYMYEWCNHKHRDIIIGVAVLVCLIIVGKMAYDWFSLPKEEYDVVDEAYSAHMQNLASHVHSQCS